jgi:hypothetical protein
MPATKKLLIAALLATVTVTGCNSSKKASSASTGTAATATALAASAAAAVESGAGVAASAPAAAAGSAAPCPLTGAQVTAAMGVTYADPTASYGICDYASSDNSLSIEILKAEGDNDFAGTLATAVQDQGTDTTTTIPGLGDKATGVGQEIVVQSGSQIIDVREADSPGYGNWPKSIALAKLVIAGLH